MSRKLLFALILVFSTPALAQHRPMKMPPGFGFGMGSPDPTPSNADEILAKLRKASDTSFGKTCPYDKKIMPLGMEYVCGDMAKFSCRDGSFNDGTGSTMSIDETEKVISKAQTDLKAKYQTALTKFFKEDASAESLFQIAQTATGAKLEPQCAGDFANRTRNNENCFKLVIDQLSSAFAKTSIYSPYSSATEKELTTKYDLTALGELLLKSKLSNYLKPVSDASVNAIEQKSRIAKAKEVFSKVRDRMMAKIDTWANEGAIDKTLVSRMKDKLKIVEFGSAKCGDSDSPNSLLTANAMLLSASAEVRFCNGLLMQGDSEFTMAFVLGHELAHSIDPCQIALGADPVLTYANRNDVKGCEKQHPFSNVVQCLRTMGSVAAVRKDWSKTQYDRKQYSKDQLDKGTRAPEPVQFSWQEPDFGALCSNDQIGESFSDWMASEIVPDYIASAHPNLSPTQKLIGYSNAMRGVCSMQKSSSYDRTQSGIKAGFDVHPGIQDRINRIIMANTRIRKDIGCGTDKDSPVTYCSPGASPTGERAQDLIEKDIDQQFPPEVEDQTSASHEKERLKK